MNRALILLGIALCVLSSIAHADTSITSFDSNTALYYTFSSVGFRVGVDSNNDANHYTLSVRDNSEEFFSQSLDANTLDGNYQHFDFNLNRVFFASEHTLNANLSHDDNVVASTRQLNFTVSPNPWIIDANVSSQLIEMYVIPLARAYSACVSQLADVNRLYASAVSLQNTCNEKLSTADSRYQSCDAARLSSESALTSCSTARSECDSSKSVLDSKLASSQSQCTTEKVELSSARESDCNSKLLLKDSVIAEKDKATGYLIIDKGNMEIGVVIFGGLFLLVCLVIAVLYYKEAIKL